MRMPRIPWLSMKFLALLLTLFSLCGCSAVNAGNSAATQSSARSSARSSPQSSTQLSQQSSSIIVTPATAQVRLGGAQQFSATISGPIVPTGCVDGTGQNGTVEPRDDGSQPLRPCAKILSGTNSVVTWSVNGVLGGNTTVGTIAVSYTHLDVYKRQPPRRSGNWAGSCATSPTMPTCWAGMKWTKRPCSACAAL